MIENTDTRDESSGNSVSSEPNELSGEKNLLVEPGNIATKQEIQDMETHAQELHKAPGHGWKHYFFEFFMLFLAVFTGFLAENYREHILEHQRENQYIQSLIADLRSDQQVLSQHMSGVRSSLAMMDSLITLLNSPSQISDHTGQLYYWARIAPRLTPLSINNRTFEQLKNSGNFRLIRKMNTSNRIMAYYEMLPLDRLLESINETEFTEYKKVAAKIFEPAVFLKMEGTGDEIKRTTENPPLRITGNEILQELSVFAVYLHGTRKGILGNEEKLKIKGAELIEYLQKEYHSD